MGDNFSKLSNSLGNPAGGRGGGEGGTLIGASGRRKLWSLASYETYSGDTDQTELMPRLICLRWTALVISFVFVLLRPL